MAIIRPFKALRPRWDLASKIAALPYDVYSEEEARKTVEGDEYSFLRIDRAETQFPAGQDMYAKEVYEKASSMIRDMESKGEFVNDGSPCFYVYELTMDGRVQTGLAACSAVDDYINGVIKKHENTRREKEEDRVRHVDTCNAQTGPIFLAYRGNDRINALIEKNKKGVPDCDFTREGDIRHRVWTISDEADIEALVKEFAALDSTYIADGHHRAASAVRVSLMRREAHPDFTGEEEYNFFLSVLFPADQLKIMDYNRVVKTLNGSKPDELLEKLEEKFEINGTQDPRPRKKGEIGMYLNEKWYMLNVREEFVSDDPVQGLDVAYLQREVLSPVFGIDDPTTDTNIDFVGGIRGLKELERRCHEDCVCAFAMYPTDILELFSVADAHLLMPPKSTWFEPKLLSGLFIHKI